MFCSPQTLFIHNKNKTISRDYLTHLHQQTQTTAMSRDYTDEERRAWEIPDEDETDDNFVLALRATQPFPPIKRLFDRPRRSVQTYIPGVSIHPPAILRFINHFIFAGK